jgi:putative Mg2+ transporter-C (MgtC) family protein
MAIGLGESAVNLLAAAGLGAAIGVERQWRQRLAGLRTNALVALGAAGFVVSSQLVPGEVSPTRVAAQIVSGIGFLGAGVIFREGADVKGLNTAATLWCAAGVGMLAGFGALLHASLLAALVLAVHLLLRPLVRALKRRIAPAASRRDEAAEAEQRYAVSIICRAAEAARVRAALVQDVAASAAPALRLMRLESAEIRDTDSVEVQAGLAAPARADAALERIVGRLGLDPGVTAVRWRAEAETATD